MGDRRRIRAEQSLHQTRVVVHRTELCPIAGVWEYGRTRTKLYRHGEIRETNRNRSECTRGGGLIHGRRRPIFSGTVRECCRPGGGKSDERNDTGAEQIRSTMPSMNRGTGKPCSSRHPRAGGIRPCTPRLTLRKSPIQFFSGAVTGMGCVPRNSRWKCTGWWTRGIGCDSECGSFHHGGTV